MASEIQLLSCCVRVCVCVSCVAMLCESTSIIAEPSIMCNGVGPPGKICVFQGGALRHNQDEYFVPAAGHEPATNKEETKTHKRK